MAGAVTGPDARVWIVSAVALTCAACAHPPQEASRPDPSLVPLRPVPGEPSRSLERYRFVADLDFDGVQDLMLSHDTALFGNAGGSFDVYLGRPGGKFTGIGRVFAHPLAVSLTRRGMGDGGLTVYLRSSAVSGSLVRHLITAAGIEEVGCMEIHPSDGGTPEGRAEYARVFNDADRLKPEISTTRDGEVSWADYRP